MSALLPTSRPDLYLRELVPGDAFELFNLLQANRAHLTRHGDYTAQVAATMDDIAQELAYPSGTTFRFGIFRATVLIGRVDLVGVEPPRYSLGYWLDAANAGQGIATEAVRAAIDFAFSNEVATDFFAGVTHGNERSVALLRRLGFHSVQRLDTYTRFHRAKS